MSKTDKGVFIFNEWFESARGLSGLEFKKLFLAMYEYQIHGKSKPSFTPNGEAIARIVFPCIEKRIKGAEYAMLGAREDREQPNKATDPPNAGDPDRLNQPTPATKEKKSKEKNSIIYSHSSVSPNGETRGARVRGGGAAKSESDKFWNDFFDDAVKCALKKDGVQT